MNVNKLVVGAAIAFACVQGEARAEAQGVLADGVYTITVAADAPDVTLNADDIATLGTNVKLVKAGEGRLIISTDMSAWEGDLEVSAGYLRLNAQYADGKAGTGTLTVTPGATLELGGSGVAQNAQMAQRKNIYIGGTGVGGTAGALCTVNNSQNQILKQTLNLTADTLVKCPYTIGPRTGKVYLNGHTLTASGAGMYEMCGSPTYGPGEIYVKDGCNLYLENSTQGQLNRGDGKNILRIGAGSHLLSGGNSNWAGKIKFDIVYEGDGEYFSNWNNNQGAQKDGTTGAIELKNGGTVTVGGSGGSTQYEISFDGPISGAGNLAVNLRNESPFSVTCPTNTFAGLLTMSKGVALLQGMDAIPWARIGGIVGAKGATVKLDLSGDEEISDDDLYGIARGFMTNSTPVASDTTVYPVKSGGYAVTDLFHGEVSLGREHAFVKELDAPGLFCNGSNSTLVVASAKLARSNFINHGGELKFAGEDVQDVGWMDVRGGTVTVEPGACVNLGSSVFVGAAHPNPVPRLCVKGSLVTDTKGVGLDLGRNLNSCPNNSRGIVEVCEGAVVTNALSSSEAGNFGWGSTAFYSNNSIGSLFMRGGSFFDWRTNGMLGNYQSFFLSMEDGLMEFDTTEWRVARRPGGVYAVFQQSGGTIRTKSGTYCYFGCGGSPAHYHMTGGTFEGTESMMLLGRPDAERQGNGSTSVLTLEGDAYMDLMIRGNRSWMQSVQFSQMHNSFSELNLNGGTIAVNAVTRPSSGNVGGTVVPLVNTCAILGFNGGTLKAAYDSTASGFGNKLFSENRADHVWVFEKGARIDVDNAERTRSLNWPLEAPTGKGLASIALPQEIADAPAWEFTAAPYVKISDPTGVGTGATAVAVFDTKTGKVTEIRVTNHGCDYAESPTIEIYGGGQPNRFYPTATLADNVSGGLTKLGDGTLEIPTTCTYTGATEVAAGTLKLTEDGVIAASCGLLMSGGTLDANGKTLGIPLLGGSGTVKNLTGDSIMTGTALLFQAANLVAKKTLTVDKKIVLAAGATVDVDDLSALETSGKHSFTLMKSDFGIEGPLPALSEKFAGKTWSVYRTSDGKMLKLNDGHGTAVIIR